MVDALEYDVFISYARRDNQTRWVSGLRDAIYDDFKEFSSEPFRIFLDTEAIRSRQDWELRLRQGLRSSRVLLVCLSPNYLRSEYCKWEWEEFARLQARRRGGGDAVTGVYFVELGGDEQYDEAVAAWRHQVERVQLEPLQPWFPAGVAALQQAQVRARVKALGQGVHEQLSQARRATRAPGNLRRHNPGFVGRVEELRQLRAQLTGGVVGVVSAVHGIGGMGKTELAVTYAHAYAHGYQGGTWQVDAAGHTEMLEAISALALWPELGLEVRAEHLADRQWLGRRVVVRLGELTAAARRQDEGSAACLLLLDNVSEPALLSAEQLGLLPRAPWFHVVVTTRLGVGDVGAVGARASVGMIEVGRLGAEDALALIRDHQPARDPAKLRADFSSPAQAEAARQIVALLDGYALAIEQAAVYLGSSGVEPSQLLGLLRAQGTAVLDEVGGLPEGKQAILHKEKITATIVDQTVDRLPTRARAALAVAALLPPDTIPWSWLQELTETPADAAGHRLPGLSSHDWAAARRLLEGRRLLTPADDPRFARLHRVLGAHIRQRLPDADTGQRLDAHLQRVSEDLQKTLRPDIAMLGVTATTINSRLTDGRHQLAHAGLGLIEHVRDRFDITTAHNLATATQHAFERLAGADPDNPLYQRDVARALVWMGGLLAGRGEVGAALEHYTRSLHIAEPLAGADPDNPLYQRDVAVTLEWVGNLLAGRGEVGAALEHYTRALHIAERLAGADPDNPLYQRDVARALGWMGGLLAGRGEVGAALEHYTRALHAFEGLAGADPDNPRYQRDVAVILGRVGDLLAGRGEVGAALEHHSRALHAFEGLAGADPDNPEYQRDVAGGWGLCWPAGVRWARRWSTTAEPCTPSRGWPGRTRTTRAISVTWRSSSGGWGLCWPGGVRWARRWSTTPAPCTLMSGWPARTPTTRSISAVWRPPSSRWGICWPAGVRWARRWSTTADRCTLLSGWPGRTPTTPNISATWRPPSSGWGICWPGGARWARRWSTSPEPCTLLSGWPGRTPTTPNISATWRSPLSESLACWNRWATRPRSTTGRKRTGCWRHWIRLANFPTATGSFLTVPHASWTQASET